MPIQFGKVGQVQKGLNFEQNFPNKIPELTIAGFDAIAKNIQRAGENYAVNVREQRRLQLEQEHQKEMLEFQTAQAKRQYDLEVLKTDSELRKEGRKLEMTPQFSLVGGLPKVTGSSLNAVPLTQEDLAAQQQIQVAQAQSQAQAQVAGAMQAEQASVPLREADAAKLRSAIHGMLIEDQVTIPGLGMKVPVRRPAFDAQAAQGIADLYASGKPGQEIAGSIIKETMVGGRQRDVAELRAEAVANISTVRAEQRADLERVKYEFDQKLLQAKQTFQGEESQKDRDLKVELAQESNRIRKEAAILAAQGKDVQALAMLKTNIFAINADNISMGVGRRTAEEEFKLIQDTIKASYEQGQKEKTPITNPFEKKKE